MPNELADHSWAVDLLSLAGLVYGTAQATRPSLSGQGLYALVLTFSTAVGWIGWRVGRRLGNPTVGVCAVVLICISGGAMTALASFGAVVVGVAALCAATLLDLPPAALLAALGVVSAVFTLDGQSFHTLFATGAAALLGLLLEIVRHQRTQRLHSDLELVLAQERGAVEHERAELMAERNRTARKVHDVLAHTLSALAAQMTVLDTVVTSGAGTEEVRALIGRSRRLVVEGLTETRRVVQALRDDPVTLDEQLTALTATEGAACQITGPAHPPRVGLALLRVA
ncbi:histidine kinase [Streptomyces sp. NPDC001139]